MTGLERTMALVVAGGGLLALASVVMLIVTAPSRTARAFACALLGMTVGQLAVAIWLVWGQQ